MQAEGSKFGADKFGCPPKLQYLEAQDRCRLLMGAVDDTSKFQDPWTIKVHDRYALGSAHERYGTLLQDARRRLGAAASTPLLAVTSVDLESHQPTLCVTEKAAAEVLALQGLFESANLDARDLAAEAILSGASAPIVTPGLYVRVIVRSIADELLLLQRPEGWGIGTLLPATSGDIKGAHVDHARIASRAIRGTFPKNAGGFSIGASPYLGSQISETTLAVTMTTIVTIAGDVKRWPVKGAALWVSRADLPRHLIKHLEEDSLAEGEWTAAHLSRPD